MHPYLSYPLLVTAALLAVGLQWLAGVQGALELLTPVPELPTSFSSQNFYQSQVDPYKYTGPLVMLSFKEGCQLSAEKVPQLVSDVQSVLYDNTTAPIKERGTIVAFDRLEFMSVNCISFTEVMKQLPLIAPQVTDKGYPEVKAALFTCLVDSKSAYGGIDIEVIDDYFYHLPKGIEVVQVGLDTGVALSTTVAHMVNATLADDSVYAPLMLTVTDQMGPWNEVLFSHSFSSYLIFYHVSHAPVIAYAMYEFLRLLIKSKCRFQPRFFIFLGSIFFLVVSAIFSPADALSRVQNFFRYLSWAVGYVSLYSVMVMWLRIMQKIMYRRYVVVLKWLFYAVITTSIVANGILMIWSFVMNSFMLYFGWGIHSYGSSIILYLSAVIMVFYGFQIMRHLDRLTIPSDTKLALKRLSLLSYVAFSGGMLVCVALMLVITTITQHVSVCVTRTVLFHIATITQFTAIFWILRVRDTSPLRRRHLMLVSGSSSDPGNGLPAEMPCNEDGSVPEKSAYYLNGGHSPYTPKISQPTAYISTSETIVPRPWSSWFSQSSAPQSPGWWQRLVPGQGQRTSQKPQSPLPTTMPVSPHGNTPPTPTTFQSASQANTPKDSSMPADAFYFPGGYFPSQKGTDGHSTSASTLSVDAQTKDKDGYSDYPNPLEYFVGPKLKAQQDRKANQPGSASPVPDAPSRPGTPGPNQLTRDHTQP
ncbi:hypothetical protein H4R35_002634 [Dimargaris xerosporica]|nr:hypothetical protein H4R35_002634 [Dimargaris xerosporica]